MRTDGVPYVANTAPDVTITFFDISAVQVGGTYNNAGRVVYVHTKEEPYTGNGVVHLLNTDGALNAIDFRGSKCYIQWGYAGNLSSVDEPRWVGSQRLISQEGILVVELVLLNAWEMLEHDKGINVSDETDLKTVGYGSTRIYNRTTTIKDIISDLISETGTFLNVWNLDTLTQLVADATIDTYTPLFATKLNEPLSAILRRLLQMTESVITFRAATGATLNLIDGTLPGPYYTYELHAADHPFYVDIQGQALVMPNKIIVVDQEPDPVKNQAANFVGISELASQPAGTFGEIRIDPFVIDDAEALERSDAALKRLAWESVLGEIYAPLNTCQELYDEIEIIDSRMGNTYYSRAGIIERTYIASSGGIKKPPSQREQYVMKITLGGIGGGSTRVASVSDGINDIDTTVSDLKSRGGSNPFIDSPQMNKETLSQHLAPEIYIDTVSATITRSAAGVSAALTGSPRTYTSRPTFPLQLVTVDIFMYYDYSGAAAGDIFSFYCYLDGSQYGQVAPATASGAAGGGMMAYRWQVVLPDDDTTHTIDIRVARTSGAGTWHVFLTNSQIHSEIRSYKNLVVS